MDIANLKKKMLHLILSWSLYLMIQLKVIDHSPVQVFPHWSQQFVGFQVFMESTLYN